MAKVEVEGVSQAEYEKSQRAFSEFVAKYYGDPAFRAKADADPTNVLKAEGVFVLPGRQVKLLHNSEKLVHVVIPSEAPKAKAVA